MAREPKDPMAQYRKAMLKCEKHLDQAADALLDLYRSARDAGMPGVRGEDDGRLLLARNIREYSGYLSIVSGRR